MKIVLIADAHGNELALGGVLEAAEGLSPDARYFLGDAIGYLPAGDAVITALESAGYECQQGNHEDMVIRGGKRLDSQEDVYRLEKYSQSPVSSRIDEWPTRREVEIGGRRLLMVHGSPDDELWGYVYPDSDLERWYYLQFDAVFLANTHRPFIRIAGELLFCNVGSAGLPRDQGNLSSFLMYDTETNRAEVYRCQIPVTKVLSEYGAEIHSSVRESFARQSASPLGVVLR